MKFWAAAQRGEFLAGLRTCRVAATSVEVEAFNLLDADLELISCVAATEPTGLSGVESWLRIAEWQRGELADEEDGSLHIAALAEYYGVGRQDFATVGMRWARTFVCLPRLRWPRRNGLRLLVGTLVPRGTR